MVPLDTRIQSVGEDSQTPRGGTCNPSKARGGAQAKLPRVWGGGGDYHTHNWFIKSKTPSAQHHKATATPLCRTI